MNLFVRNGVAVVAVVLKPENGERRGGSEKERGQLPAPVPARAGGSERLGQERSERDVHEGRA